MNTVAYNVGRPTQHGPPRWARVKLRRKTQAPQVVRALLRDGPRIERSRSRGTAGKANLGAPDPLATKIYFAVDAVGRKALVWGRQRTVGLRQATEAGPLPLTASQPGSVQPRDPSERVDEGIPGS